MKFKQLIVSILVIIFCVSICTGCSSLSAWNAEDGSVQKEMTKNADLKEEIADIFNDTGLSGDYKVKDNTVFFKIDMSNFTITKEKDIDEKEEQRVVKLCERSFSNEHEFDTIIKELKEHYNLKDVTLIVQLEHKNKILWSKEYKLEKKSK